jgi:hypothetical protein
MNNQPAYDGKRRTQTLADVQETIARQEKRRDKRIALAMADGIVRFGNCTDEAREWCRAYVAKRAAQ